MDRLIVVGGGPKAMAVAAKAQVLRELGLPAPQVTVVEPHVVGGNWLPDGGWTNGQHRLGTSPEKDVGFPYRTQWAGQYNRPIDTAMLAYSWTRFLVERGTYAEWVDRGRPHPRHHLWATYLQWIAQKTDVDIVVGRVTGVSSAEQGWTLQVEHGDQVRELAAERLMITGPGDGHRAMADHARVLSIAEFWELARRRELPVSSRTAVIGGGETAGSAMDELVRHDMLTVSVISPGATIYTRGESYFENSLFSDPARWRALSLAERRDVVRRTDRGVFSVAVQESLLTDSRVHHLQGRVIRVLEQDHGVALTLRNELRPDQTHTFDVVIDATGGHPLWFLDLFDTEAADVLELAIGGPVTQTRLEAAIGPDLAVDGLPAPLYLPNLAGMAQGPGFPNLSCLGGLSDRVLGSAEVDTEGVGVLRSPGVPIAG